MSALERIIRGASFANRHVMTGDSRKGSLDRRTFVRVASLCAVSLAAGSRAFADQILTAPDLTIGTILPRANSQLVDDVAAGVELGFDEAARSAALFQKRVTLVKSFFASTQEAASAATNLLAVEHATVLIGGGSDDECRAITAVSAKRNAVFMNIVSRSDDLRRSNCTKFVVHVEASDAMYASASILAAEHSSSSPSTGCDVVLWHSSLERYGASQLNDRFTAKAHRPMTGSSWAGWMAVKAATESYFRAGATDGESIAKYMTLDSTQFDGHKGAPLSFRTWDRQLRQPLYCVENPAKSSNVRDVPDLARSTRPARELLDELGDDSSRATCPGADR